MKLPLLAAALFLAGTAAAQQLVSVVSCAPASVTHRHLDRSAAHLEYSLSGDSLLIDYDLCTENACLDHAQFTAVGPKLDAATRKLMLGQRVIASVDAKGAVTLAPDVQGVIGVQTKQAEGRDVDEISVILTVPSK